MAVIASVGGGDPGSVIADIWPSLHVLVVGDVMLDKYIWGQVDRISPEAPIPIVRVLRQTEQPGGAANVAMNIAALGARVSVVGLIGADADGEVLRARLAAAGIFHRLTVAEGRPTSTKTRVLGDQQQMLRIDVESSLSAVGETHQSMLRDALAVLDGGTLQRGGQASAVILSDYAKGVLSEDLCQAVITRSRASGIPVIVDPKGRGYSRYRGATTLCPNLAELALETNTAARDEETILRAGEAMIATLDCNSLTVTLSERGIVVMDGSTRQHAPAVARQVFDVSGAGDTVTAVIALCTASELPTSRALKLANLAAGLVVAKVGTAPVERNELIAALASGDRNSYGRESSQTMASEEKVTDLETMARRVAAWRTSGKKVVFTNGCFDLLHTGHLRLLEAARAEGDRLIVGLNSDTSVRNLKGTQRPVLAQGDRAAMLAALAAVDGVVVFEEETPLQCVLALRPEVLVKGGDYAAESIVGSTEVRSWGGTIVLVPLHAERSTTAMIADVAAAAAGRPPSVTHHVLSH